MLYSNNKNKLSQRSEHSFQAIKGVFSAETIKGKFPKQDPTWKWMVWKPVLEFV